MRQPIAYRWNGNAMVPLAKCGRQCREQFTVGGIYRLKQDADPSEESRGHYYACIKVAFDNLPEKFSGRFSSPEHLRKWCLIRAGYRTERTIVAMAEANAHEIAALASALDEYAVVVANGAVVTVMTAATQKLKRLDGEGMDKQEFEKSKSDVLTECSKLIGVDVTTLLAQSPARRDAA